VLVGRRLRPFVPDHHLSAETRDAVKLALGLVATMAALLLGLLVSSAKGSYDTTRGHVIQMAAKVAYLNRVLESYGPEAAGIRPKIRDAVEAAVQQVWPGEKGKPAQLVPNYHVIDEVYFSILALSPRDDIQRTLKGQAVALAAELGQSRMLLLTESVPSIKMPLLVVVVAWLVVIYLGFSVIAPPNATATTALLVSALAVSGAILLILDLVQPFNGIMKISSEPVLWALKQLAIPGP
jgi:hypothetical protein